MTQRNIPWRPVEGDPTRLYLLRHGEVASHHCKYLYGQMDVELSDRGKRQSENAGHYLKQFPIKAVYTSDLTRARTLAREIARHHAIQPQVDTRLRERHFGHWQGLPWKEIEERFPDEVARYSEDRYTTRVPGGAENFVDVRARIVPFLNEIISRHYGQSIALTAHSGPVRIVLAHALNMPIQSIFTFEQDFCCLNIIEYYPNGRTRVLLLNETRHIEGLAE